jgi:hypothetical protein
MLQPYSKKRLQPGDVMRFPWDETPAKSAERKESRPREELSDEELMERYRAAVSRTLLRSKSEELRVKSKE